MIISYSNSNERNDLNNYITLAMVVCTTAVVKKKIQILQLLKLNHNSKSSVEDGGSDNELKKTKLFLLDSAPGLAFHTFIKKKKKTK